MIDSKDKMIPLSKEHAVQLNLLMKDKNYPSLVALYRIEEHNIKEAMATMNPEDPNLKEKTIFYLARLRQLRYLNGYLDRVKKKVKENGSTTD